MNIVIVLFTILLASTAVAENIDKKKEVSSALTESNIKILENRVKEIRQGQLNYKIEKNLIKDAYSSNLETINLIITIVLGVFSVLGFLGITSIYTLRNQFQSELDEFRSQRKELNLKLSELKSSQNEVKSLMNFVSEENKIQDSRLKILEIQEKSARFINQNPKRALEYIAVGLEISPDDMVLLSHKQQCYFKLAQFEDALNVAEQIIKVDKTMLDQQIANIAEINLFLERYETFDDISSKYKKEIEKRSNLAVYFKLMKYYLLKENTQFIETIKNLIFNVPNENIKLIKWSFDEARIFLSTKPDTNEKKILITLFLVLEGKVDKKVIDDLITEESKK